MTEVPAELVPEELVRHFCAVAGQVLRESLHREAISGTDPNDLPDSVRDLMQTTWRVWDALSDMGVPGGILDLSLQSWTKTLLRFAESREAP